MHLLGVGVLRLDSIGGENLYFTNEYGHRDYIKYNETECASDILDAIVNNSRVYSDNELAEVIVSSGYWESATMRQHTYVTRAEMLEIITKIIEGMV